MRIADLGMLLPIVGASLSCHANTRSVTDDWCNAQCNAQPPNCQPSVCWCDVPIPAPTPPPIPSSGNTWVFIAAGSSTYSNYRHQADACHAYQVVRSHGVHPDRIILMMYDDVANDPANPFPGKLFNEPDGPDVYAGCEIDYRGDTLTPELYKNVLLGNAEAVQNVVGSGKVLQSGPDDRVFVYFADHGGSGIICFPGGLIHAADLMDWLKQMHSEKKFNELLFYLDTCEAGSMFTQLPSDIGVLAWSSSPTDASAYGTYCSNDVVGGTHIGSCLADVGSAAWMHNSDTHFNETLGVQIANITAMGWRNSCPGWGPPCIQEGCEYGDKSMEKGFVGWFQADLRSEAQKHETYQSAVGVAVAEREGDRVNARDMKLYWLQKAWDQAPNGATKTAAWDALQEEISRRNTTHAFFENLAVSICGKDCLASIMPGAGDSECQGQSMDLQCQKHLIETVASEDCPQMSWDDFSGKYAVVLANLCKDKKELGFTEENLVAHVLAFCHPEVAV